MDSLVSKSNSTFRELNKLLNREQSLLEEETTEVGTVTSFLKKVHAKMLELVVDDHTKDMIGIIATWIHGYEAYPEKHLISKTDISQQFDNLDNIATTLWNDHLLHEHNFREACAFKHGMEDSPHPSVAGLKNPHEHLFTSPKVITKRDREASKRATAIGQAAIDESIPIGRGSVIAAKRNHRFFPKPERKWK